MYSELRYCHPNGKLLHLYSTLSKVLYNFPLLRPLTHRHPLMAVSKHLSCLPAYLWFSICSSTLLPLSTKVVQVLVWSQCLLWNHFFVLQLLKNQLPDRKTGQSGTYTLLVCNKQTLISGTGGVFVAKNQLKPLMTAVLNNQS